MTEDMDINCGDILDGVTIEAKGREILDKVITLLRRSTNGGEIDISLPGTVRAFGAAFGIVSGSLFTVTVEYSSGSSSTHSLSISDTSVPVFLGFVTDAPITNLHFIADFGLSALALNNVMIADASGGGGGEETPEASTMLLIGGGLVTLRLFRRFRRTAPGQLPSFR